MDAEYSRRKALTFGQAEGLDPMPTQLSRSEVTPKLRALLWNVTFKAMQSAESGNFVTGPWESIFYDLHVNHFFYMADAFSPYIPTLVARLKPIYQTGSAKDIYGATQFLIRHRRCPMTFSVAVEAALLDCHSPYRVYEGDTLMPLGSDEEAAGIKAGLAAAGSTQGFGGAYSHLRAATRAAGDGDWPGCVRDSIHAVESTSRVIAGTNELGAALNALEKSAGMHGGMKAGFKSLYGYASDEKGIRHPLLDEADAKVDEADALFMLGACASFVSYLINKARIAGLIAAT